MNSIKKTKMFSILEKNFCNALSLKKHRESTKGTVKGTGNGTGKGKENWKNTALRTRWRKGIGKTRHFQSCPGKGTGKTHHFQSRPRKGIGKTQQLQSCPSKGVGKTQQLQSRLRKGNGRGRELNQQSARKDKVSWNRKKQTRKNYPSHSLRSCWPPLPVL